MYFLYALKGGLKSRDLTIRHQIAGWTLIARHDNAVLDQIKLKLPWLCAFSRKQRTMEMFNVLLLECFIILMYCATLLIFFKRNACQSLFNVELTTGYVGLKLLLYSPLSLTSRCQKHRKTLKRYNKILEQ